MGCRLARAKASAVMGEEPSVRMTLPIDMKNLIPDLASIRSFLNGDPFALFVAYPKVAPEPSMYCPKVLIAPFGPPPYLMTLTPPSQFILVSFPLQG